MKIMIKAVLITAILGTTATAQDTLRGTPTTNVTLSDDCYVLEGCYIIESGVTLTINAGVTVRAMEDAALIVEPGGQIEASGTANTPIVFTTVQTPGTQTPGFWHGIQIAGDAPVNNGLIDLLSCSSMQAGGTDSDDDAGTLEYVQIHYAGKSQSNPLLDAGLALLALGDLTQIANVQVSNSATNGINIVGGTVNAKWAYLLDNYQHDIFITDGYTGNLQHFYAERKNPNAHVPGSNGMVIQNNAFGNNNLPHTRPVISNFTINGPGHCNPSPHGDFNNALQLQNNARADIWNSFFAYYPEYGVFVDDDLSAQNTVANELNISYSSFTGNNAGDYDHDPSVIWSTDGCGPSMTFWLETSGVAPCFDQGNQFGPFSPNYDASFCDDYCDGSFTSDFTLNSPVSLALQNPNYTMLSGFDQPDFRGAIQDVSVFDSWVTVCPAEFSNCTVLQKKAGESEAGLYLYPNPAASYTDVRFESKASGKASITIMDKVSGRIWQQRDVHMQQAGKQQFRVPVRGLPENVYILQVSTPAETLHGQLLIQ